VRRGAETVAVLAQELRPTGASPQNLPARRRHRDC
jgi:hypothetical protein